MIHTDSLCGSSIYFVVQRTPLYPLSILTLTVVDFSKLHPRDFASLWQMEAALTFDGEALS